MATLGFAPFGHWYLTLLALSLLLALAINARPWRAVLLAWLYGFAHFLTGVYWVYISTHVYGGAPAWLGALLTLALANGLAIFPATAVGAAAALRLGHSRLVYVGLPALWALAELLRGRFFFGGFPWLSLGELALDTPALRLAPLVGVHGMAAVAALMAVALYRIGQHTTRRERIVAVALLASPLLCLLLPRPSGWTQPDGAPVRVALVQSDIRQDEKWLPAMRFEALSRHWRLTQQAWPADVVVWPEVALTQPLHQLQKGYLDKLGQQAQQRGATILLGVLIFEGEAHYNSVVAVGASQGRYDKRHLVPFGEFFPIPDFARPLMDVLGTPYKDFTFGAAAQPLPIVQGQPVALSICFEDVFGDEVRRELRDAAYGVNVTNDAWFAHSSAPYQHLAFTRLRAAENGRWFARTANTGISAIVDADGNVVQATPQFQTAVLRGTVEPRRGWTPYGRWGDHPLWWVTVLTVIALAVRRLRAAPFSA